MDSKFLIPRLHIERRTSKTRNVIMARTQRNINRMTRLFDITYDFAGMFQSRVGSGLKMLVGKNQYIVFAFNVN